MLGKWVGSGGWAGAQYWGSINPLNAELNPICHLLALLGAHHILHVSRIRFQDYYYAVELLDIVIVLKQRRCWRLTFTEAKNYAFSNFRSKTDHFA